MADEAKPAIMAEKDGPLYIQGARGLVLLDSDGNPYEIIDDEILCAAAVSHATSHSSMIAMSALVFSPKSKFLRNPSLLHKSPAPLNPGRHKNREPETWFPGNVTFVTKTDLLNNALLVTLRKTHYKH